MSYIRCLSNPEALYIYGDCSGYVNISHGVKPPLSSGRDFRIPNRDFHRVGKKWADWCDEESGIKSGHLKVQEINVYRDTGKPVGREWRKNYFHKKQRPTDFLVRISYKRDFVFLWRVTWEYVVHSIVDHIKFYREHKKRGKK